MLEAVQVVGGDRGAAGGRDAGGRPGDVAGRDARRAGAGREFVGLDAADADAQELAEDGGQVKGAVLHQFDGDLHQAAAVLVGVQHHQAERRVLLRHRRVFGEAGALVGGVVHGRPGQILAADGADDVGELTGIGISE